MPIEPWTRPGLERIVLVGFMAAGKSTVGRILAERLGWSVIDFDERIRERTGRTSGRIIREAGEAAFRRMETELTEEVASAKNTVLAPGGGWAVEPRNRASLGAGTVVVWLRITPEEAVRRAEADAADRPLLGEPEGGVERATALLRSREPSYAAADIVIDVNGKDAQVIADEIVRRLHADSGGR